MTNICSLMTMPGRVLVGELRVEPESDLVEKLNGFL